MKNNGIGHLVLVGKDSTLENRWPSVKWKISMPCSPTIPNYCRAEKPGAVTETHERDEATHGCIVQNIPRTETTPTVHQWENDKLR